MTQREDYAPLDPPDTRELTWAQIVRLYEGDDTFSDLRITPLPVTKIPEKPPTTLRVK